METILAIVWKEEKAEGTSMPEEDAAEACRDTDSELQTSHRLPSARPVRQHDWGFGLILEGSPVPRVGQAPSWVPNVEQGRAWLQGVLGEPWSPTWEPS